MFRRARRDLRSSVSLRSHRDCDPRASFRRSAACTRRFDGWFGPEGTEFRRKIAKQSSVPLGGRGGTCVLSSGGFPICGPVVTVRLSHRAMGGHVDKVAVGSDSASGEGRRQNLGDEAVQRLAPESYLRRRARLTVEPPTVAIETPSGARRPRDLVRRGARRAWSPSTCLGGPPRWTSLTTKAAGTERRYAPSGPSSGTSPCRSVIRSARSVRRALKSFLLRPSGRTTEECA